MLQKGISSVSSLFVKVPVYGYPEIKLFNKEGLMRLPQGQNAVALDSTALQSSQALYH